MEHKKTFDGKTIPCSEDYFFWKGDLRIDEIGRAVAWAWYLDGGNEFGQKGTCCAGHAARAYLMIEKNKADNRAERCPRTSAFAETMRISFWCAVARGYCAGREVLDWIDNTEREQLELAILQQDKNVRENVYGAFFTESFWHAERVGSTAAQPLKGLAFLVGFVESAFNHKSYLEIDPPFELRGNQLYSRYRIG